MLAFFQTLTCLSLLFIRAVAVQTFLVESGVSELNPGLTEGALSTVYIHYCMQYHSLTGAACYQKTGILCVPPVFYTMEVVKNVML